MTAPADGAGDLHAMIASLRSERDAALAREAALSMENARLLIEQSEALERQSATAEVLQVINASPGDLGPVFDAMLESAMRLCGAAYGILRSFDGARLGMLASRGVPAEYAEFLARNADAQMPGNDPMPGTSLMQALQTGNPAQTLDARESVAYTSGSARGLAIVNLGGARTILYVPLAKDGATVGLFTIYRQEVRAFSDKQIALLLDFAAQAVIAMENARLLNEQREALEQQTATAEVLQVINASPGNLEPVFRTILLKAHELCGAAIGNLLVHEGGMFRAVATHGCPDDYAAFVSKPFPGGPYQQRLLDGERLVHVADTQQDDHDQSSPIAQAFASMTGFRTLLMVPLRKDDVLLGLFSAFRTDVQPFNPSEISLLENFAGQAVIAMENARLLGDLRQRTADLQESLEYQTAISDVLKVISRSTFDLHPVLTMVAETAARLCIADQAAIIRHEEGMNYLAANCGFPPEYEARMNEVGPIPFDSASPTVTHRAIGERRPVHIHDVAAVGGYPDGPIRLGRQRTSLGVPLLREGAPVGVILLARQRVEPFTDRQIELVSTFADQAVIAIENARLLTEQREALERQTATAEVLQVINASPGNLAPVFDAMLEKALRLCDAAFGNLWTYDGEVGRLAAMCGASPEYRAELMRVGPQKPDPGSALKHLVEGERLIHIADITAEGAHRSGAALRRMLAERGGARTALWVPMRKDDALLGFFTIYRTEVRPFADRQIALLQDFAAQAVIAMENARLLTEQREALEQQTATAEVLGVINSSPGDLAPVFEAMLEKGLSLCNSAYGQLNLYDGEYFHTVAVRGAPAVAEFMRNRGPSRPDGRTSMHRITLGESPVHILDVVADEAYGKGDASRRALVELGGMRTLISVALRKDETLLGAISIYRQEVRAFSNKEIALLQNFAAQAVIAIENARLLNEIQARQSELRITFENMGDGVALFDEASRLIAWNRKFQEMFDLPDTMLEQHRTYEEHLRFLAARGDFGAADDTEQRIHQLTATTDRPDVYERMRPDGRVLEIRRNPVPAGGFVLIFSDITERKRNEADIRAARDAAEAAYCELKAAQASLIQAEKMASLGQLTAGIAHEIKNPLNFVNNFADLSVELLDEVKAAVSPALPMLDSDQQAEVNEVLAMVTGNLAKITEHGRRADGIVRSMLEHSRGGSGDRRRVDLNTLVDESLNLAFHGARAQDQSFNVTLQRDFAEGIAGIDLVPQDITRVLLNLIGNGFYAARNRQRTEIAPGFEPTLVIRTCDLGDAVEILIRDNGTGIPPEVKDKLFQPFFTTKPTGEGTGLGLSISYDIVTKQHGGTITVDSKVGDYSEFTIRLPRNPHEKF